MPSDNCAASSGFICAAGETREVRFTPGAEAIPKGKVRIAVGGGQPVPQIPHVVGTL